MPTVLLTVLLQASNFVGASPVGFAGFLRLNVGSYEVFYEHVFAGHHGVRAGFDFIHVHHSTEYIQSHQWTFGGNLTVPLLRRGGAGRVRRTAPRLPAGLRALRRGGRSRSLGADEPAVVGDTAARLPVHAHPAGVAIGAHVGVGYGPYQVWASTDGHLTAETVRFSRDLLGVLPIALDTELSVSVAF